MSTQLQNLSPPPTSGSMREAIRLCLSVSRFHIVAIAALGTLTFGWLFTGQYLWTVVGFCALDWFVVNLLNRVVDLPEDRANAIRGAEFVARHRPLFLWLGFGVLGGSLLLGIWVHPELIPFRLAYHALGLTYNWPLLPGDRRIKALYFWKNTASAVGFLLTVFAYPVAVAGWSEIAAPPGISLGTIVVAGLFFFLFELSYEVIYDLRDAEGDARENVRTYPVVHGERGAVRIIDGLILASMLVLTVGYLLSVAPWRLFIMIAAPALQFLLYKRALRRGITSADCVGLTWLGAGLLLTYHLWILFELPGVGI